MTPVLPFLTLPRDCEIRPYKIKRYLPVRLRSLPYHQVATAKPIYATKEGQNSPNLNEILIFGC